MRRARRSDSSAFPGCASRGHRARARRVLLRGAGGAERRAVFLRRIHRESLRGRAARARAAARRGAVVVRREPASRGAVRFVASEETRKPPSVSPAVLATARAHARARRARGAGGGHSRRHRARRQRRSVRRAQTQVPRHESRATPRLCFGWCRTGARARCARGLSDSNVRGKTDSRTLAAIDSRGSTLERRVRVSASRARSPRCARSRRTSAGCFAFAAAPRRAGAVRGGSASRSFRERRRAISSMPSLPLRARSRARRELAHEPHDPASVPAVPRAAGAAARRAASGDRRSPGRIRRYECAGAERRARRPRVCLSESLDALLENRCDASLAQEASLSGERRPSSQTSRSSRIDADACCELLGLLNGALCFCSETFPAGDEAARLWRACGDAASVRVRDVRRPAFQRETRDDGDAGDGTGTNQCVPVLSPPPPQAPPAAARRCPPSRRDPRRRPRRRPRCRARRAARRARPARPDPMPSRFAGEARATEAPPKARSARRGSCSARLLGRKIRLRRAAAPSRRIRAGASRRKSAAPRARNGRLEIHVLIRRCVPSVAGSGDASDRGRAR